MRFVGESMALGTAASWSIAANSFAYAGRRIGPVPLNRLRIVAAAVLIGVTLLVTRGAPWPTWASNAQLGWLALSGLIGFVFADQFYFYSLANLGPGRSSLIAALAPVFTAILGAFLLDERPGPYALLGMAMTLAGVTWVLLERQQRSHESVHGSWRAGVIAGVLGALGQAGGYVVSKVALRTGIDALSATMIRITVATAAMWGWALVRGEAGRTLGALGDRRAALAMVAGATFGPYIGVTLSLAALHWIQAGVSASIIAFYPVLTILIASRVHHEPLTWRTMISALVAVGGVVVLFIR